VAEQSIPLFGYMWWPNDSGARGGLLYTPAVVAFLAFSSTLEGISQEDPDRFGKIK
jgi:hypothetical protein